MAGVLYLGYVFQLIVDCLDNCPLPQEDSVIYRSESTLQIVLNLCNQPYAINEELVEQVFAYISLASNEFPIYEFNE